MAAGQILDMEAPRAVPRLFKAARPWGKDHERHSRAEEAEEGTELLPLEAVLRMMPLKVQQGCCLLGRDEVRRTAQVAMRWLRQQLALGVCAQAQALRACA